MTKKDADVEGAYMYWCRVCHIPEAAIVGSQAALHVVDFRGWFADTNIQVSQIPFWVGIAGQRAIAVRHHYIVHVLLNEVVEAVYLLLHQTPDLHELDIQMIQDMACSR